MKVNVSILINRSVIDFCFVTEIPPLVQIQPFPLVNDATRLTIQWPLAPIDFVTNYIVNIRIIPTLINQRDSQTMMSVPPFQSRLVIDNPEPVADYIIDVDAVVMPPGSPSVTVPVVPPAIIRSAEQRKQCPLSV